MRLRKSPERSSSITPVPSSKWKPPPPEWEDDGVETKMPCNSASNNEFNERIRGKTVYSGNYTFTYTYTCIYVHIHSYIPVAMRVGREYHLG